MERKITINVDTTASLAVDEIEIDLSLNSLNLDYSLAYKDACKKLESLQTSLAQVGFDKKDIKTVSYNVSNKYNHKRNNDGSYSEEFVGFNIDHSLVIKFDYDSNHLADVLSQLSSCNSKPKFNIRFSSKNVDSTKDKLLKQLSKLANQKAKNLAKYNNVTLKQLVSVDYNYSDSEVYSPTLYAMNECAVKMTSSRMDMTVQDLTISASATFVWEIE